MWFLADSEMVDMSEGEGPHNSIKSMATQIDQSEVTAVALSSCLDELETKFEQLWTVKMAQGCSLNKARIDGGSVDPKAELSWDEVIALATADRPLHVEVMATSQSEARRLAEHEYPGYKAGSAQRT
ncbi:hypothetical protein PMIT1303_01542 [Prochlorococcus sp. MIT 1303]|nr:hypothetical protein PMIT1303_01542 [Prochlorococcus sp. MIT 1303]